MSDAFGRAEFERALGLSPEIGARVEAYRALLAEWSQRFNLIGPRELETFWRRHALDCAQLVQIAPNAKRWLDLGSGAGLPGLIVACVLADTADAEVHLVESTGKKATFLREAIAALHLPAKVFNQRIEDFTRDTNTDRTRYDVVTARALAPLPRLIEHAKPILDRGAQGLFHKGADVDAELAAATHALKGGASGASYRADVLESMSDPRGRIIRITKVARR